MSFLTDIFTKPASASFPEEMLDHDASKLDYVVIDCEMTGLKPKQDRLLSIAAVKISQGRIQTHESFYRVIYQEKQKLRDETILIHRLNHQQISTGSDQMAVLNDFCYFCQNCIPVGHFFDIDLSFLNPVMPLPFSFPNLDTRLLVQSLDPSPSSIQLNDLCDFYELPSFEAHNALGDATSTACLFLKILSELRKKQLVSLQSILNLTPRS